MRLTENGDIRITEDSNTRIEEFEEITYPSSINRVTVISFPLNDNREDITTGIEAGSLYLNKLLFQTQINYGESNSDRFEVTLFDCDDISKETIQVYQLDYTEDENNPVRTNLFYGVVDSCLSEDNGVNRKLVAYDLMYDLGNKDVTEWWNNFWSISFTATVEQLLTSLLTEFDVTLNPNIDISEIATSQMVVTHFSGVQSITFGTILAYIGQVLMVNPHFNEEGQLDLVKLGANFNRSIFSIEGGYEDENSHFEDYTTEPVTRVAIYGETDVIAGEYGTGDNVYVVKNNPLLFNISGITYRELARIFYENLSGSGISYTPANIKMIVSKTGVKLGDIVKTPHGSSVVSAMELSGPMLVEQTIVSTGNQKLTPADFDLTGSQVGTALEQSTTTAKHFVWVDNDGAYVTTDNIGAGQAPTNNYSKLTDAGLYVATDGKEVAHFGIDENDEPVSVLGSTETGNTSVIMSSEGILAGKQVTDNTKIDYFNINVPDTNIYSTISDLNLVVAGNNGYLDLSNSGIFLDVSQVGYTMSYTVTNSSAVFLSLSDTRGGHDIVLEDIFDIVFKDIQLSGDIYSIPLIDWINAWCVKHQIPATAKRITLYSNATANIYCEFYNVTNPYTTYPRNNATDIRISVDGNLIIVHKMYLQKNDYSFNVSEQKINILNQHYFAYTTPSAPREIGSVFGLMVERFLITTNTLSWLATMLSGDVTYQMTLGDSVTTNRGINSVVLGDNNTVTEDSQFGVFIAGSDNTVDNNRIREDYTGVYVLGKNNTVEHHNAVVVGRDNNLTGTQSSEEGIDNVVVGNSNTVDNNSADPLGENKIFGSNNNVTGLLNIVVGQDNSVAGSQNVAIGQGLRITNSASMATAVGKYNVAPSDGQFVIGCGEADNNRKNAMSVNASQMTVAGDIYFNSGNTGLTTQLANKQAKLVSGTNIKTINGTSILGSGNIATPDTKAGDVTYANPTSDNKINSGVTGGVIVHSFSLSAGLYIVEVGVSFSTNATGYRMFGVTNNSSATDFGGAINRVSTPAHAGYATNLSKTVLLQPASTTTYYIKAYQNSGSNDITVSPRVRYTKLK